MKLLLSIFVIAVATVTMVSSRAVLLPLREDQGTLVRLPHGMLDRVAREAKSNQKLLETIAQDNDAKCIFEDCEKLEELKKALLAIVEQLTCPHEPESTSDSYSNSIGLGLIDL